MSIGRSLKATRDYLVSTLVGAIYTAALVAVIPRSGEEASLLLLVGLTVAPLALFAAINPSLSAATITAIIVLLSPAMNHAAPFNSAIDRIFEVAVGAMTGLFVTFLVLPSRAHGQVSADAAKVPSVSGRMPPKWNGDRFDVVLRFDGNSRSGPFTFRERHPCLLHGDLALDLG